MSLEVKLEDDDKKFIKEVKGLWSDMKKQLGWMTIALVAGFVLGKIYTWDTIITDCKVLGMFRIHNTPFNCRIGYNLEDKK